MKTTALLTLFALIGVSLNGCGTVCNLVGGMVHPESEPRIFGGVLKDIEVINNAINPSSTEKTVNPQGKGVAIVLVALIAIATVDPMVSLAADILTLPITIPLQENRIAREQEHNGGVYVPSANPASSESDDFRNAPIHP